MTTPTDADRQRAAACPDCGATPGQPHDDGCDVALCTVCGWQRIGCEHEDSDIGWGQIWTGERPGRFEVRTLGLTDLNDLDTQARSGRLVWDQPTQQWRRAVTSHDTTEATR